MLLKKISAGRTFKLNKPHGRRANGLDLSEAVIIVDYIAIKNFPSNRATHPVPVHFGPDLNQGCDAGC